MAHCAEIKNGIVKRVIVVQDMYGDLTCEQWCEKTFGGIWKQCSYNSRGGIHYGKDGKPDRLPQLRKNYPGEGWKYDEARDAFYQVNKPYPSWIFDEQSCIWKAPIEHPDDGRDYKWDETISGWIERKLDNG